MRVEATAPAEADSSAREVIARRDRKAAEKAVAARADGKLIDLSTPIAADAPRDAKGGCHEALRSHGRDLQGRDARGHPRRARLDLSAGRLEGPLPRSARPVDVQARGLQAVERRGRVLAGRRAQRDAAADL